MLRGLLLRGLLPSVPVRLRIAPSAFLARPSGRTALVPTRRAYNSAAAPVTEMVSPLESLTDDDTASFLELLERETRPSALVWVSGLLPVQRTRLSPIAYLFSGNVVDKIKRVFELTPDAKLWEEVEIYKIQKEGGAYIKVFGETVDEAVQKADALVDAAEQRDYRHMVWKSRAFRVRGVPFVNDISSLYPSSRLIFECEGPPLKQDDLYNLVRPYGRIMDIQSNSTGVYTVQMWSVDKAIAVCNCLHNFKIDTTRLRIRYASFKTVSFLSDAINKHPRLVVVFLILLIPIMSMMFIDPVRVRTMLLRLQSSTAVTFLCSMYAQYLSSGDTWEPAYAKMVHIHEQLATPPKFLSVIIAPQGSGKGELLAEVVRKWPCALVIECGSIVDADQFVETLSSNAWFVPSFSWANTIGAIMDTVLPSSNKVFASDLQFQLQKILGCLGEALEKFEPADEKDYPVIFFDGFHKMLRNLDSNQAAVVMDAVFRFAVEQSSLRKRAHVFFVSDDPFAFVTPQKYADEYRSSVNIILMNDMPLESAMEALRTGLPESISEDELKLAVDTVGGRISDVQRLIVRAKTGMSILDATEQLIDEAINHIRAEGFRQTSTDIFMLSDKRKKEPPPWSSTQLWDLIHKLVKDTDASYDEVLFTTFKGDENALRAILSTNLFHVKYSTKQGEGAVDAKFAATNCSSKVDIITAVSPLYRAAFKAICTDPRLSAGIQLVVTKAAIATESAKLKDIENELVQLRQLVKQGGLLGFGGEWESQAVSARRENLEKKLYKQTQMLEELEKLQDDLLKVQLATAPRLEVE